VEPRILIADDEVNILRSMAKTLSRAGYAVETAPGNQEAYDLFCQARAANQPFALIILDLNMPDFAGKESKYAGLELLARIKAVSPGLPVIANSAWDEVETAKRCLEAGAADYFVKGRNEDMLVKIRQILSGYR
jgi:DNA-binding response OmpR family regulator